MINKKITTIAIEDIMIVVQLIDFFSDFEIEDNDAEIGPNLKSADANFGHFDFGIFGNLSLGKN